MKHTIMFITSIYISFILTSVVQAQQIKGSKSGAMFRANPQNTGVYETKGVHGPPDLKWKFKAQHIISGTPVISNGMVYFGTKGGHFYAVDTETGKENWKYIHTVDWRQGMGMKRLTPSAVSDSVVYFGSADGYLFAFDAITGKKKWSYRTVGAINSSPIVSGESVYFGSSIITRGAFHIYLYSLDKQSGKNKWESTPKRERMLIQFSPAVADGVVYLVATFISSTLELAGYLYAFDEETGKEKWSLVLRGYSTAPAVTDGIVYTVTNEYLYTVDSKTGQERWKFKTGKHISLPSVTKKIVYLGSGNHLYAVDSKTGQERWKFKTEDEVASPFVADGIVYFNTSNYLYALDAKTGQEKWKFNAECPVNSPVISDGVIYFGCGEHLYAVMSK